MRGVGVTPWGFLERRGKLSACVFKAPEAWQGQVLDRHIAGNCSVSRGLCQSRQHQK